jgi:hypothetical protein
MAGMEARPTFVLFVNNPRELDETGNRGTRSICEAILKIENKH